MSRDEIIFRMIYNEMNAIRRMTQLRRQHFNTPIFWKRNRRRELDRLNQKENESETQ